MAATADPSSELLLLVAAILLATLLAGLLRALRGPTVEDRMLAALLASSTTVGIVVVLSRALDQPALRDVALVTALLAAVAPVVLTRGVGGRP